MVRFWPLALVVVLFGGIGLVQMLKPGHTISADARAVQTQLDAIPLTIGAWQGKVQTIPEKQLRVAEAQASLSRTYTKEAQGATVQFMVLYGGPGPLGAHTPEICFQGAGFKQIGNATKTSLNNRNAEFWHGEFEQGESPSATLNVYWGWGANGAWKASDQARFDFATYESIYKIYASWVVPRSRSNDAKALNPVDELLPLFLDELQNKTKNGQP